MLPFEILEAVERELNTAKFTSECSAAYIATIRGFIIDNVVHPLAKMRKARGMFEALERFEEWHSSIDLSVGASGTLKRTRWDVVLNGSTF